MSRSSLKIYMAARISVLFRKWIPQYIIFSWWRVHIKYLKLASPSLVSVHCSLIFSVNRWKVNKTTRSEYRWRHRGLVRLPAEWRHHLSIDFASLTRQAWAGCMKFGLSLHRTLNFGRPMSETVCCRVSVTQKFSASLTSLGGNGNFQNVSWSHCHIVRDAVRETQNCLKVHTGTTPFRENNNRHTGCQFDSANRKRKRDQSNFIYKRILVRAVSASTFTRILSICRFFVGHIIYTYAENFFVPQKKKKKRKA